MSEETNKEVPAEEITLDRVYEETPYIEPAKSQETTETPETTSEKEVVEPEKKEEVAETATPAEEKKVEETPEKEPEKPNIYEFDGEEYTEEDVKTWKSDSHQKEKWVKSQTQRSQIINKISDEEIVKIQTELRLRDKVKEVEPEKLPDQITLNAGQFSISEDYDKVTISSAQIQQMVNEKMEAEKAKWANELAPNVAEYEKMKTDSEQRVQQANNQASLVNMNQYFKDYPDSSIELGEDPIQTLNDIKEAGSTHPDYRKLLNITAVAQRSAELKIGMKEAHIDLFGKTEQQKKAEKKIKEEQAAVQQEKPGQTATILTDNEQTEKELGIGNKMEENVFD